MPVLDGLYRSLMRLSGPALKILLRRRMKAGKEDPARIGERMGISTRPRPAGTLAWIHAASVGEAQSALILVEKLTAFAPDAFILVTTGTVTSANLMQKRLSGNAFHQYIPLDHPAWVTRFFDHWKPDVGIWLESELWPNLLFSVRDRHIPALLVNACLSDKAYRNWKRWRGFASDILNCFCLIVTQTEEDATRFRTVGAHSVISGENIKYSASPLPVNEVTLAALRLTVANRPCWVYASTHAGEEHLACRVHSALQKDIPDLLTIIVPRHPSRGREIRAVCESHGLSCRLRSDNTALPRPSDAIYIADTMGELGLFYSLCPVAMIGRSFSNDGGGGHNPIEAAQFGCAVVTGPNNQDQRQIYNDMAAASAAIETASLPELERTLRMLLTDHEKRRDFSEKSLVFANKKTDVANTVFGHMSPYLQSLTGRSNAV